MAMSDVKTLGHTATTNPSQLGNTAHSLINNNKNQITSTSSFHAINNNLIKPVSTLHNPIQIGQVVKPSLFNAIPKPAQIIQNHTLQVNIPRMITPLNIKPSLSDIASKTSSTLNVMTRMLVMARPSMIPKPHELPKPIISTLPILKIAPPISEQQAVINSVVEPVVKTSESTIKSNVNAETVDKPPELINTSSTLPTLTSPPPTSTAIIVPQQGNIFEMIMQFISKFFNQL